MRKLNCVFCFCAIFLLSCTEGGEVDDDGVVCCFELMFAELTGEEALSLTPNEATELSDEEVVQAVNNFISAESGTRSTRMTFAVVDNYKISLGDAQTRSDVMSDSVTIAVVNLDEKKDAGFATVCRDSRYPEVLAYVPNVNYEENKSFEPLNMMLARTNDVARGYILKKNAICARLREKTLDKVCKRFRIERQKFDFETYRSRIVIIDSLQAYRNRGKIGEIDSILVSRGYVSTPSGTLLSQAGPLCGTTRLIQGWPCNQYIQTTSLAGFSSPQHNGHYPAGCVNVALATICSYLQPTIYCASLGRNIDWTNVVDTHFNPYSFYSSESSESTDQAIEVANLIKIIADGTNTSFGENGGVTTTKNAAAYMQKIGVDMNSSTSTLNYANVRSSLGNLALVFCTGTYSTRSESTDSGHAWVIDGLQIRQPLSRMELQNYNCYASCKFGWIEGDYGATNNGWFLFDTTGTITFDFENNYISSNLSCIPNIKLK